MTGSALLRAALAAADSVPQALLSRLSGALALRNERSKMAAQCVGPERVEKRERRGSAMTENS